ncbi:unnamed protein product [Paramecium pentaurelia]|uniref:PA domain-containing protein n=1 Tax=Paramecium pentaurelia TaxID=43138 RepID=A0A8S1XVU0_9CILI|nr:unnamed protein product [Paramecium pentaurelia]
MQIIFLIICIVTYANCKLKVIRPAELVDRMGSKVNMALANFGQIPFGHRLMGYVEMADPYDGCSALKPSYGSQFVLIERGNCTFVTKVKNAQNAGYMLAIIGNHNDEPLESDFVMADDGHGYSVNIPSIFITLRDFNIMKEYATRKFYSENQDDQVFILVKFDVEKRDQIDVVLSLDVKDGDSYRVIDEFSQFYKILKNENVNLNSTPIVDKYESVNLSSEQRRNNEDLPTPAFPTITNLKKQSYSLII